MSQEHTYYRHSGAIGPLGPVYMVILGTVGVIALGAIYGYAIFYIPFIYLNFFITLGFGAGVGFLVGYGAKLGKVRNSTALVAFGLIFGALAAYAGWVSWIYAASEQEIFILQPGDIWGVLGNIAETGAWSIFGWTPTGAALFIIWGIEAIMIIALAAMMAWGVLSSTPYCEHCNKWVEDEDVVSPLAPVTDPDALKVQLESGDLTSLQALEKLDGEPAAYAQLKLRHCPTCENSNFLSLSQIVISKDKDNKEKKDETKLVENLRIAAPDYETLRGHW